MRIEFYIEKMKTMYQKTWYERIDTFAADVRTVTITENKALMM